MKHLNYLFAAALITILPQITSAQYVSFTKPEISRLKKLIKTDAEAISKFGKLKKIADESLQDVPLPADTIFSEGILAGNPKKVKTQASLRDIPKTYALAMTYALSGGEAYRDKAIAFLYAWATVNKPQGNPINDTKLDGLIQAYDLIQAEFPATEKKTFENWLRALAQREQNRKPVTNNWNSHRLKVLGLVAYTIGDTALQHYTTTELEKHIARNLYADGSGYDFIERDALHYHVYTLEPLLKLAIVMKRAGGKDYYNYVSSSGSSIQKSVAFLVPFVAGAQTHPEFVNSKVKFDQARAKNNEPGYQAGKLFSPAHGATTLSLASYFDPKVLAPVNKLAESYELLVLGGGF